MTKRKIVVAISGATGAILGVKLLQVLKRAPDVETHLVVSDWAKKTIQIETEYAFEDVTKLADVCYDSHNVGASIASGSFGHSAMVIMPCSMKTLAGISMGYASDLIVRAADVTLKERRKLILAVRETPLNQIHLENMLKLTQMGAMIYPFMPSFYNKPESFEAVMDQYVSRVASSLDIDVDMFHWENNDL